MPEDNITVLILKGVKRVKSIKINRNRIRFTIVGGTIFVMVFAVSVGLNVYQLLNVNPAFQNTESLQQDNTIIAADHEEQETELPGNDIASGDGNSELLENNDSPGTTGDEASEAIHEEDVFSTDISSNVIGLVNLNETLLLNKSELKVTFSIYKKDIPQESVSGRFFIVAKTSDVKNKFLSYPKVRLNQNGTVQNFRAGESFYMRNLTIKEGRILLSDKTSEFEYYQIYIYSNSGELLLQKTRIINAID